MARMLTIHPRGNWRRIFIFVFTMMGPLSPILHAQTTVKSPASGKRYQRLVVRNAMIVDGNGTPASGPKDIVIEGNTISEIVALDPVALKRGDAKRPAGDVEIEATGKYVLPGLINAHVQEKRGELPQPLEYELKLWLACGITTVRDVGASLNAVGDGIDVKRLLSLRQQSNAGEIASPRIFIYALFNSNPRPRNPGQARGVDDQRRHPVPRPDAALRSENDGREGAHRTHVEHQPTVTQTAHLPSSNVLYEHRRRSSRCREGEVFLILKTMI